MGHAPQDAERDEIMTPPVEPEIRAHRFMKIALYWEGDGEYYPVDKLGLWLKIKCQQVRDFVANRKLETIQVSENETRR
jgi:hypothetical protein